MIERRDILAGALAAMALLLTACGLGSDPTSDYRYLLTVEVDTPEGLKTGSSVIEVRQSMGRSADTGFGEIIMRRVYGEAVSVDLPGRRKLFALLRSEDQADWAGSVMQYVAPKVESESLNEKFDNMRMIEGERELPRHWHPSAGGLRLSAYPMLVTFGDLFDPTSVAELDSDDLADTFGEGVSLKRITVQMTDDPVTTGIVKQLEWLDNHRRQHLDGTSTAFEDMTTDDLTAHLTAGSFSTEFAR